MERIGGEATRAPNSIRKVVVSSIIGTAPALVFPELSFSTFAAVSTITGDAFEVWGWRVSCLLSVVSYALAPETYPTDIYAEEPQERLLVAEQG
jgi:hypothetical protein